MRSLKHKVFDWVVPKLSFNSREQMFRDLGESLGVKSFTCEGELGIIEGNIKDQTVHGYYLRNKTWAPWLQKVLKKIVFPNAKGTFVDIGANIGLTVIPAAKAIGVQCLAFEPEKMNYALLRKNILLGGVEEKVKTYNMALFSSDSELEFELSEDNMGDHRVRANSTAQVNHYGESRRKTTKVAARRLDGLVKAETLSRPIAIKLDVQGAEVKVFQGGKSFFERADFLFVEFWPYGIKRMGDSPVEFLEFIKQFPWGAIYNDVSEDSALNLKPIAELLRELLEQDARTQGDTGHWDLVLSREKV